MHMRRNVVFIAMLTLCQMMMAFEEGDCVRLTIGGKTLMVENSNLDVSKPVVIWTETNTNSQRWILENAGKGCFYLRNAYTNYYLGGVSSTTAGAVVGQISKENRSERGNWLFEPVEGQDGVYIAYLGVGKRTVLCSKAQKTEGSAVKLHAPTSLDEDSIQWKVEIAEAQPNELTTAIRDDMMDKWCNRYYHEDNVGHIIGRGGFWGDAEMFEIVLDALETTGDERYATMFSELYKNFCRRNNTNWSGNEYNDDITWMCIACVRAYLLTGIQEYRTQAKENFDRMYARANIYGDGTLVWKQGSAGTNSCINGPAAVCACYLGIALGSESYFNKAATIYAGERGKLYEFNDRGVFSGKVYDSYDTNKQTVSNPWSSTYNQGTCLGAAVMLYNHYGKEQYKSDADAIMSWTAANLATSKGIVHVCQTVKGDLSIFKGILMRYVRRYAADLGHPEYYNWIAKNALHAWNNRNSEGISMSAWMHKTTEDFYYSDGGDFSVDGVGTSTALSAAFNAHLGVIDQRKASDTIQVETFNFLSGPTLKEADDADATPTMGAMRQGYYLGFRAVDFGNEAASHIILRLKAIMRVGRLRIYADDPKNGTLLASINMTAAESAGTWLTIEKELDTPISGVHNIYIVGYNTLSYESYDMCNLNWFTFESRNTLYSDLTNNGGRLTTSMESGESDIAALIDDSPYTNVTFSLTGAAERWVQYESPAPIRLKNYTLMAGLTANSDPTAWILEGSNDGEQWTVIDEQTDVTFTARAQRKLMILDEEVTYSRFRLTFTATASDKQLILGEWQLLGQSISEVDVTADGGILSEGAELLIDKKTDAAMSIALPLTVKYQSMGNNRLTAYTLTVSSTKNAPSAWELYGSNNGNAWVKLDQQENQVFPFDNSTLAFSLAGVEPYIYYRLNLLGEGTVELSEWQLLGTLDFGTFSPELTRIAQVTASDGSDIDGLIDDNGNTYATLEGENMKWSFDFPMEVRVVGYSLVAADDPDLNPKSIALIGSNGETSSSISSRTVTLPSRGSRITNTVSSSKTFRHIDLEVRSSVGGSAKARLSEVEIYGTAFAESGSSILPEVDSLTASAEGLTVSEGIDKLTDQVRTTKYRADFSAPVSITMTYNQPQTIDTYAITAAKDEEKRDPKAWKLMGSNDGETWDVLDECTDETFLHRYSTHFYSLSEPRAYTKYRLQVTEVAGANQLQLGQVQFLTMHGGTAIARLSDSSLGQLSYRQGSLQVNTPHPTTLRIYDAQGRMRLAVPLEAGEHTLSLSQLPRGMFIVAMQVEGRNVWHKILR